MDRRRSQRVSEALREELVELIGYELSDPRVVAVTVTGVQVSPDLRSAQVWVLCGETDRQPQALRALEGARHYLRRELAGRLRLWRVPELHFAVDSTAGAVDRIEQLLERVKKDSQKPAEPAENQP
jgi:ribosome-binding factor A